MRYIAFPSYQFKDNAPSLPKIVCEGVVILSGPSPSGLFIIEVPEDKIEILKFMIEPYYILMEDFKKPITH